MALSRRNTQRFASTVWPGFVDAMTALLLVLMFVLTIFMVVQSVLRETLTSKEHELSDLTLQVADLAQALSLREARVTELEGDLSTARTKADAQAALIATLSSQLETRTAELDEAGQKITAFEAQVASLLGERDAARADAAGKAEELRLGAEQIAELRDRLKSSGDELAAMTLALEAARLRAEETLTLLAAAEAAKANLQAELSAQLTAAEKEAALKGAAQKALESQTEIAETAAKKVALLNEQVAALRAQMAELQGILNEAQARDEEAKVQVDKLGSQLNAALAQVAAEQRRRAEAEAARAELEAERARNLERYRSEFFGRLSEIVAGREGVRIVGDRFVFSSEVLFAAGSADLAEAGKTQIAQVTRLLTELSQEIPPDIDWIIRVDGHTDDVPLSGEGEFKDNWELSQARALSVVRYMVNSLGFPPRRLVAAGFGEYRPVVGGISPQARAANRRIELKLTER
ncbi:peptidoglycan -binding protein [Thioclava sp. A2]|uniref:peptidoglycan -binding protein n=1 Tax=Thioclava sp. FCG-A2 TaxID=3080562 RepID=UPI0029550D65|nr:peptidoglycan -binding protein [Thioclava sp. A2]MDV7271288.1 peptidoglycan -binding protein [Thioclava sp. A2]